MSLTSLRPETAKVARADAIARLDPVLPALPSALFFALLSMSLASLSGPAWALYKVVGPDGRVTYTDRAPVDKPAKAIKANGASTPTDALPYDLQKVVSRFPVTLYTGNNCTPCDTARQLLKTRGVPFTALDADPEQVDAVRKFGLKVFYGDAGNLDLLHAAQLRDRKSVV